MTGGKGTSVRDPGPGMKATDNNKTLGYFFFFIARTKHEHVFSWIRGGESHRLIGASALEA